MKNTLRSLAHVTTSSHLFSALMLSALGAAILVPLSGHPVTTVPTSPNRVSAHAQTHVSEVALRPAVTTTVPPTTTTTAAPVAAVPTPAPVTHAAPPPAPAPAPAPATTVPSGYGCGPALAYLQSHSAPGFTFECPGYAEGHQAMTCDNVAGVCPGTKLIAISTPCPAAYMNEASNSWVVIGESHAALDPYGYCH